MLRASARSNFAAPRAAGEGRCDGAPGGGASPAAKQRGAESSQPSFPVGRSGAAPSPSSAEQRGTEWSPSPLFFLPCLLPSPAAPAARGGSADAARSPAEPIAGPGLGPGAVKSGGMLSPAACHRARRREMLLMLALWLAWQEASAAPTPAAEDITRGVVSYPRHPAPLCSLFPRLAGYSPTFEHLRPTRRWPSFGG